MLVVDWLTGGRTAAFDMSKGRNWNRGRTKEANCARAGGRQLVVGTKKGLKCCFVSFPSLSIPSELEY